MSDTRVPRSVRRRVFERAQGYCEYCLSQAGVSPSSFSVEHVRPKARGGGNDLNNLALCCQGCNGRKSDHVEGIDPPSEALVPLYNPRVDHWHIHFAWDHSYTQLLGLTPTGRATIRRLGLNRVELVRLRRILRIVGEHPPLLRKRDEDSAALWLDLAARANTTLSTTQLSQLSRYLDLLFEANATMNLTRITTREAAEVQHVADSLTLLPLLPAGPHRLADVGSGGGVPGIPLAIARPDVQVTLIEATKKKAAFLERAAGELGLANVRVLAERAEAAGHLPDHREAYDVVVCRAVATMDWLVEWCLPLATRRGKMLAMKGPKVAEEIPAAERAIKRLNGGPAAIHRVDLAGAEGHVIVEIAKLGKTDSRLPRPAAQAKGKPLR